MNENTPQSYEEPVLIDLGDARDLTLGSAQEDTADLNQARYN
ncbi:lasso RiPP family leader peptide-containing protein [Nocardiopsis alba]|nr:lasso RiPP family leader peptide-containing protein [Nocardiopsis alba]